LVRDTDATVEGGADGHHCRSIRGPQQLHVVEYLGQTSGDQFPAALDVDLRRTRPCRGHVSPRRHAPSGDIRGPMRDHQVEAGRLGGGGAGHTQVEMGAIQPCERALGLDVESARVNDPDLASADVEDAEVLRGRRA
jgi:hypothetical protein